MSRPSPLQNRVTPDSIIIASPARGTMMGNRGGCLHTADKVLGPRRWVSRQWICCRLAFAGRHREVMAPCRYTELFFLDEATAFAAGHRPCFECRRADARRFAELWGVVHGGPASAADIDRVLHAERLRPDGGKRTFRSSARSLPDGAFVRLASGPALVMGGRLLTWTVCGYQRAVGVAPDADLEVLTPKGTIAVLNSGYRPMQHGSAADLR